MDNIHFFTHEQGNLLVRLLLAHILADFILQTKDMAENKTWFSRIMVMHLISVFAVTLLLSFSWKLTLAITLTHYLIDGLKQSLQKKYSAKKYFFFMTDQALHVLMILALWAYTFELFDSCYDALKLPFLDYKLSLYVFGYALVIWPLGYLIRFFLEKIMPQNTPGNDIGKLIGQFERIIILTFVLLGQYEAIGFLITGKSIIRFADKNSEVKSEYVLVGTMMSYALCILIGLGVKGLV